MTQPAQGTRHWNVSKHYSLQGDSSEEEDLAFGKGLCGGNEDCVCCVCGETFTFNNLIEHFNVHKGEVRCYLCQVTFTRAISLALHLENAHPNYNLYCESCNVKFWSTWQMNQHMEQHFEVEILKVEPPHEDIKAPQSESQKPLWLEVEKVMVKNEEVEIQCMKDEEEEVPLGKVQETESIITSVTKEVEVFDHNYFCSKDRKENDANIYSKPIRVLTNGPGTKNSNANDEQEEKVEVVVLHSLPQKKDVLNTDTAYKGHVQEEELNKIEPNRETTQMSSLSPSTPPELELAQLELNVKLEDDNENELLECAPIEEDAEGVENIDHKEGSDSSVHSSLYSSVKDLSSDTDSAFDMSTDYDSNSAEEGSIRLLRSRAVKKRRVRFNTNEKSVSPEIGGPGTEANLSNCSPLSSIKISNENNLFSNYTCLTCRHVFPNQKTFLIHSCGNFRVTGGRTVSSIKRLTEEDKLNDHTYSSKNSGEELTHSNQTLAQNTRSVTGEQKENNEPVNTFNDESDTEDSDTEESECEQQENVEIVVLRAMPQTEGVTNTGRVVLQAMYEKVIKTQVREEKPRKTKKQKPTHKSSQPNSVSVKLEPEQLELCIKKEDSAESNTDASLWECAPIEEDDIESIKEEENTEIKEENDNLDISLFAPVEDSSTEIDGASEGYTDDDNSDHSEEGSTRNLWSSTVHKSPICTNTIEMSASSIDANTKLTTSKSKLVPSSVKVSAGPQLNSSKEKPYAAPKPNSSIFVSQICTSCGLSKVPSKTKPSEQCRCMSTCHMCCEVYGSEQLLQKHQAEKHPFTQYVCSTCGRVFSNQNSFVSHACRTHKFSRSLNVPPLKTKNNAKKFLEYVQSSAFQGTSNPPLNSGGSQTVGLNLGGISNPTISMLPNNPGSTQTVPVQVIAPVTLNNGRHDVASLALNERQASVMPVPTAAWANTGQMQVLIPSAFPASTSPNQTEIVFQGGVQSKPNPLFPVVPGSLLDISATGCNQSKAALRIPTYSSNSNKVSVSFSPTPIQFPTPTLVSAGYMKTQPSTSHNLPGYARSFVIPFPKSTPAPPFDCGSAFPLQPGITSPQDFCPQTFFPEQAAPFSQDSLKIVTMFLNQSQELVRQKRMRQTWRNKTVFPCRHCGIIGRQPSLGIRHRYQHRGPRPHKCQCGRTFQQRLHLLRHQVQHAEAVRYVCAACGQTFHGTQQLASHKHKVLLRSLKSNTKKLVKRDCRNLFHCDCGQGFVRSSALLWHMLKNFKLCKRLRKGSLASDSAT